jgi:hypothetical protein
MTEERYPEGLPLGLRGSRSVQLVSPLMRSNLASGRARQRRKHTDVPEIYKVSWLYSDAEAQAFQAWYRDALSDGASYFECPLKTPMGINDHTARFTDVYQGPNPVGHNLWSISAELELQERAVIGPDWGEFPEFILYSSIIDVAANQLWPLNQWQIYAEVMDAAINEDWPKP